MIHARLDRIKSALAPCVGDQRLVRLGKLSALALIEDGRAVTRATLVATSRKVDVDENRKKRGFSEASLRTNGGLRAIYEISRTFSPRRELRRRGKVGAHILRMTKIQIATAIVVGRLASLEREDELRLAIIRHGGAFDLAAVKKAAERRETLPINDHGRRNLRPAGVRATVVETVAPSAKAIENAKSSAARQGVRPTIEWLAERCKLHPATVERHSMLAASASANARTFDFPVQLPSSLLRHRKWDLARGLQVERDYIRALHTATMTIAAAVIDAEHQERRAAVRAATIAAAH